MSGDKKTEEPVEHPLFKTDISESFALFILSFVVVSFGQPAMVPYLGMIASVCGFAFFWKALLNVNSKQSRFWISTLWFTAVQAIQLQWLASTHYMGGAILWVYGGLIIAMGLQFGVLSLFFEKGKGIRWGRCLAIAGAWTLLEWSRLFVLTGFTFNPVGISLTDSVAIQLASIGGIFGLSFWVIFVNLLLFNALISFKKRRVFLWGFFAVFPYFFGWLHPSWVEKWKEGEKEIRVALVQTALLPEERSYTKVSPRSYIQPMDQWKRVWNLIGDEEPLDLIVLPESAFPFGASRPFISYEKGKEAWVKQYGIASLKDLPPLEEPYVRFSWENGKSRCKLTQAFFGKALANHFHAHVIIGLDDEDPKGVYNAAFHFQPEKEPERYEKRILVPVSEYLPMGNIDWLSAFYAKEYNIFDSCTPGIEAKIFSAFLPIGPSICYEETFSQAMRELRLKGAQLFVNVSNDVWYPKTLLPHQHFHHAKVRAAENGVYLIRACNTGMSGIIDSFGKPIITLPVSEEQPAVLHFKIALSSHPTLYMLWGDWMILILSASSLLYAFRRSE